jgi:hypothetical protein
MGIESHNREGSMPKSELSMTDAIAEIGIIEQRVRGKGAVDVEPAQFALLRSKVINAEITPQKGVEEATKIEQSQQDYH